MTDDDTPATERWFIPTDDVEMDPRQFGAVRPEGMNFAEGALFDAVAAGTTAAFNRMGMEASRHLTEAALGALTRADTERAIMPWVELVAASPAMQEILTHAMTQEALWTAAQLWTVTYRGRPQNAWGGLNG